MLKNSLNSETTMQEPPKSELRDKILAGLELTYEKLLDYKRAKNSVLVVIRDNKIVHIKPDPK
jgi:hypothetical protein